MRTTRCQMVMVAVAGLAATARAQVVEYTDETAFLNALTAQGDIAVQESFEDDFAWGAVRSTITGGQYTAPSVSNLGITWSSSSPNNEITTGPGPARTGDWGFFSLPHGDYANGITDGLHGVADQPLVAIGGWVDGTYGGRINLILDGDPMNPVDFGGANGLGGAYQFFGAIDPGGFTVFDILETEGTIGDQKYIFGDDFTFAFGGAIQDCNGNGLADPVDIADETSTDCNNNAVPDECEIDINSTAPGGPFFCTQNCPSDCNDNGILDECEVVEPEVHDSGQLSPIGNESPQTFTIASPPVTLADVTLDFTAYANLGRAPDHISVNINGVPVGTVFGPDGSDCPEAAPDLARLVVPEATFNAAVNGGDAVIGMVASDEVDPEGCDLASYISINVTLFITSASDIDGNGVPDECEPIPGDFDGDWDVDQSDLDAFEICASGPAVPLVVGCEDRDFDNDGDGDQSDFAVMQRCITGENVFGNPACAD